MTTTDPAESTADEFGERVFASALGMVEILSIYLGDRLGWYAALAEGPSPARQPRRDRHRRAVRPRVARAAGRVRLPPASTGDGPTRGLRLTPGRAEPLTDSSSLAYLGASRAGRRRRSDAGAARGLPQRRGRQLG